MSAVEKIIGINEARPKLTRLIEELEKGADPYIITARSKAKAVLMSMARYELLMDLLEDLEDEADSELARRLAEARANYRAGEGVSLQDYLAQKGKGKS